MPNLSPAMNFRAFISLLEKQGDLVSINTPVDEYLEVGAITRHVYETRQPAPLFQCLRDKEEGFRILGAPAGMRAVAGKEYSRLAAHFDLPEGASPKQILQKIITASESQPLTPVRVPTGACKENIWKGDNLDLTRLPIPQLHAEDGGRYIGTYGMHIVQSPDGEWDSWSVGRLMLRNKNTLVGPVMPMQHVGMIHQMWAERGLRTPWAMALGVPPAALAVAAMPLPERVSEPGYVGALTGVPVEVVKCETSALYVPANAEIILEGEIAFDETGSEGPMGEYHGYSFPESKQQPLFHIRAITFRNQPILPICVAGLPPEENHTIWGTMMSAQTLVLMHQNDLPIDMAWCSYEAASCWIVLSVDTVALAALETCSGAFIAKIAEVFFSSHVGWLIPKVIVVGNDIDITSIEQVVWALATRSHPVNDIYQYQEIPGIPLVPYLTEAEKKSANGGKSIISCLFPGDYAGNHHARPASFTHSYPSELQAEVLNKWATYGFSKK